MFRARAKQALIRLGRTRLGEGAIHAAVMPDPRELRLDRVTAWPPALDGFEDLAFLFSSNQLNHGIASLTFEEAAFLYRLVRDLGPATLVEIGRFKGGSTLVTATAMEDGAELYSYDLDTRGEYAGAELDDALREALRRYGLASRVHLVVADSRTAEPPPTPCRLVFVDGDHSYAGARADYEHWRRFLGPGGHLLFHDAVDTGRFGSYDRAVAALVGEIERDDGRDFTRRDGAGSIAHFVRAT